MKITIFCTDGDLTVARDTNTLEEVPTIRQRGFIAYNLGEDLSILVNDHHNDTGPTQSNPGRKGHQRYIVEVEGKGRATLDRSMPLIAFFPEGKLDREIRPPLREHE